MNEELQSTNEELETINAELRNCTTQLNHANVFLESVLSSLRVGVAVLDGNLTVQGWNDEAEELWGLREQEVRGKHLFSLDIGLPLEALRVPIRACLAGVSVREEVAVDALSRRGRPILCKVTCSQLGSLDGSRTGANDAGSVAGVILLMEPVVAPDA
jgi:two-component system CheB/CheR fusion protein